MALVSASKSLASTSGQYVEQEHKPRRLSNYSTATITTDIADFKTAKRFVSHSLKGVPNWIRKRLVAEYSAQYQSQTAVNPQRSANIKLRKRVSHIQQILKSSRIPAKALYFEKELKRFAEEQAQLCMNTVQAITDDSGTYEQRMFSAAQSMADIAERFGFPVTYDRKKPKIEHMESFVVRMVSDSWWLRKLKRLRDMTLEYIAIAGGYVARKKEEYTSNHAVSEYRERRRQNQAYLEAMEVVNEETEERFSLSEVAAKTTANPELRRIELMVRCRGLEDLANEMQYQPFFVTWTAPSCFHRVSKKWDKSTPRETQAYFNAQWQKCRAAVSRMGIDWFGVRVCEPHADATPHWHLLVFVEQSKQRQMIAVMRNYATQFERQELVDAYAEQRRKIKREGKRIARDKLMSTWYSPRFDVEKITPEKGSATGYIAKYICKNINANHASNDPDFDGSGSLGDAVDRVTAWASLWRIRQFQFFGAAPVSVWRELRRLDEQPEFEALEKVRKAADSVKWDSFTKLLKENPVCLKYEEDGANVYGEPVRKITGLVFEGGEVITRDAKYVLERKRNDSSVTWSTVNNCTEVNDSLRSAAKQAGIDSHLLPQLALGYRIVDAGRGFFIKDGHLRTFKPSDQYLQ